MGTTNLTEKSLGDIIVSSGNGTPDHIAPKGSMYTNEDTGVLHTNNDSVSGWTTLNMMSFGVVYIQDNVSTTTVSASDTWYSLSGLTWSTGSMNGFTRSSNNLVTEVGRDGKYDVVATGTIKFVAAGDFELGVSKNDATPAVGNYAGGTVTSTIDTASITIVSTADLVSGDTLSLSIQNITNTANVILRDGSITCTRVGD